MLTDQRFKFMKVALTLCELFPRAPIYTLLYDEKATGGAFVGRRIFTSWLQKLPGASRFHRSLAMLMPLAVEQFDLSKYDLVISNSASFAKGVITKPRTKHISYCMTPTRFLWDDSHKFLRNFRGAENSQRNQWPNADFVSYRPASGWMSLLLSRTLFRHGLRSIISVTRG
ncbi:MAG: Glycosyl transferase group 1 [Parcubacteria group bacterium GW2011_GWB1_48_6]|nr:MAG: Glycosyl transferase group 1 [Parcubacteria group bacterium GW2011_GWB1_48_6]